MHGLLVVGVGAGKHQMLGIDGLKVFVFAGYPYPPAVAEFAFVEVYVDVGFLHFHYEVFAVFGEELGVVLFAAVVAFDKVP